jgi:uncharacterized protein (DUF169 family)
MTRMKRKFVLELDEAPALVFVQNRAGLCSFDNAVLYVDGEKVHGIRSLRIDASVDDITTHEIEYLTGMTKGDAE